MRLIDSTYFRGELYLQPEDAKFLIAINAYIDKYEPVILTKLLGYKTYLQLKTAYDASLVENAPALAAKWSNLVNGVDFSIAAPDGKTYELHWNGLKNTIKESLIVNFVYYKYREENRFTYAAGNDSQSKKENSTVVDSSFKIASIWNKMVDLYGEVECDWLIHNENAIHVNIEPSAYNFLVANKADYPDWYFEPIQKLSYMSCL